MDLKTRSYKKELLDEDDIPADDLKRNLSELNFINTWLGGHAISIAGLKQLIVGNEEEFTICEIGCGGGDNISALKKWCYKNSIKAKFIGVDIKPICIQFAQQKIAEPNISWVLSDYSKVVFATKPHVIFSSLFCHHFTNEQLITQLCWMKDNSSIGYFINDLQRNRIAFHLIKILTKLFSKSYLVKHDAPLSVARSFRKSEWKTLFKLAGINKYSICWKWAFRYLVVFKHE